MKITTIIYFERKFHHQKKYIYWYNIFDHYSDLVATHQDRATTGMIFPLEALCDKDLMIKRYIL